MTTGLTLWLLTGLLSAGSAQPEAADIPEAGSCRFPLPRPVDSFFLVSTSLDEGELGLSNPMTWEGALTEIPGAARSGVDYDAVPFHLGLSMVSFPARFTGVFVEGLRIRSDSDFSGTNADIVPPWLAEGLEVSWGPTAALAGGAAAAGVVNIRLRGAGRFCEPGSDGFVKGLAGSGGLTGVVLGRRYDTAGNGLDLFAGRMYGYAWGEQGFPERMDAAGARWRFEPDPGGDSGLVETLFYSAQGVYPESDDDSFLWKVSYTPSPTSFRPVRALVGGFGYERTLRDHMTLEKYDTFQARVLADEILLGPHTLSISAWSETERFERFYFVDAERTLIGLSALDEFALGPEWSCAAGASVERSSDGPETEAAGFASAIWSKGGASLKLTLGRVYRFPSLLERYEELTDMGDFWREGDPSLRPETGYMFSAAASNPLTRGLKVSALFSLGFMDDIIRLEPTGATGPDGDPVYRWTGVSGARLLSAGAGFEGTAGAFRWSLFYTNRDGKDDTGAPVAWLPRNTVTASLSGPLGGSAMFRLSCSTVTDGTGPSLDGGWGPRSAPFSVLNLDISWRAARNLMVGVHFYNLLGDEEDLFEYVARPAVRPRSAALSLRCSF